MNRVHWGCCEEGDERSISTKGAECATSRDTAVSESLGRAVSSARRHVSLKEDNLMFRVGCQCCECAVWVVCRNCTETGADMKIMQTAALRTPAKVGDAAGYFK